MKIMVGLPTLGKLDIGLVSKLILWEKKHQPSFFMCENIIPHSTARNFIAKTFLDSDCDILVFIDADIIPPNDLLDIVKGHFNNGHKIVAGYAPVVKDFRNKQEFVMNFGNFEGFCPAEPESDVLYEVKNVGFGCIAIHRSVFENMNKPYFDFYFRDPDCTTVKGEDIYFCDKAREIGFKIMLEPKLKCNHKKEILL